MGKRIDNGIYVATCHIQVYSKQKTLVIETSETEVSKKIYEDLTYKSKQPI